MHVNQQPEALTSKCLRGGGVLHSVYVGLSFQKWWSPSESDGPTERAVAHYPQISARAMYHDIYGAMTGKVSTRSTQLLAKKVYSTHQWSSALIWLGRTSSPPAPPSRTMQPPSITASGCLQQYVFRAGSSVAEWHAHDIPLRRVVLWARSVGFPEVDTSE